MRASSLGCSMRSPCPIGISRSAKASVAIICGDEILPPDVEQEIENALIEHLPRADLLLDHVEAGAFEIHLAESSLSV